MNCLVVFGPKANVLSKQKFKASESEKQIFDTETQMKKLPREIYERIE